MNPLTIALAMLIGASLGLIGGGGSILTVPALVHAAGLEPRQAIAASLVIVGATAAIGALWHARAGTFDARVAVAFGGLGAIASAGGAWVGAQVPENWLLIAFSAIAIVAGVRFLGVAGRSTVAGTRRGPAVVAGAATGVGFLTGLLGVGGGFLIVPALVFAVGLPMARAVGTSLGVIALNCTAGVFAAREALNMTHAGLIAVFAALAIAGSIIGARVAVRTRPEVLSRAFGLLVVTVGLYTGVHALI